MCLALATLVVGSFAIAMTSVPIALTFGIDPKPKAAFASARILEYLCFGFILAMFANTMCGKSMPWETAVFFLVLGVNVLSLLAFVALHYCLKSIVTWETRWGNRLRAISSAMLCESLCVLLRCCKGKPQLMATE